MYTMGDTGGRIFAGDECQDGARRCPFATFSPKEDEFVCTRYRVLLDYGGHKEVPIRCEACVKETLKP